MYPNSEFESQISEWLGVALEAAIKNLPTQTRSLRSSQLLKLGLEQWRKVILWHSKLLAEVSPNPAWCRELVLVLVSIDNNLHGHHDAHNCCTGAIQILKSRQKNNQNPESRVKSQHGNQLKKHSNKDSGVTGVLPVCASMLCIKDCSSPTTFSNFSSAFKLALQATMPFIDARGSDSCSLSWTMDLVSWSTSGLFENILETSATFSGCHISAALMTGLKSDFSHWCYRI